MTDGLKLMGWGLFKKVVVADRLAGLVQQVYGKPQDHDGVALTMATLLFAVQVYCDFSGYSDIAIGAAQTLGYKLMPNFERPYFAKSIQEFWKRWHISLSTWLTDYVYTPLTRSELIKLKWYYKFLASIFLTFIVSGLWHGAQWTYVTWGALHGLYLVSSMLTQRLRSRGVKLFRLDRAPTVHHGLRIAFTFTLVCISYIFFRASSMPDGLYIITHLFTGWGGASTGVLHPESAVKGFIFAEHIAEFLVAIYGIAIVLLVDILQSYGSIRSLIAARPGWVRWSLYYAQVTNIVLLGTYSNAQQFIYFQF